MEEIKKKYDIGVIIGRFQIHELHSEHKKVIEHVLDKHDRVILFLGVSPAINTRKNPLDYTSRKKMVEESYADRIEHIQPLHDKKFDAQWAKQVDSKIRELYPLGSVVIYGSRDSFIPHYEPHGNFDTCELEAEKKVSASEIRQSVKNKSLRSRDFRAGMIYAANSTHPHNFATIDVAILNEDESGVLLGRKEYEEKFRFVGGFTDVTDTSHEHTAKREAFEETNLEIGDIQYVSSRSVKDWRYVGEEDRGIMTVFFKAKKIFGAEKAKDDIVELDWRTIDSIQEDEIVGEHVHLLKDLKNKINN